jgi:hypothetical protein
MEEETRDRLHYGLRRSMAARGRADETAAFGAAVVVVSVFVFGIS